MGYKLELLSPQTMKLLESTKKDANQDKKRRRCAKIRIS